MDKEFDIEIKEVLSRVETVKAESLDEAINKAMDMYYSEKIKAEMSWSLLWVSAISSEVCQHQCSKVSCTEWSWTAYREGLQNSFTRMPISALRDLKTPHIRITSLMLLWEMCRLEIIRYLIQSTISTTSVFTIIFLQRHSIR